MTLTLSPELRARVSPWLAPAFAAVLTLMMIATFWAVKPHTYEVGFPVFLCFLPMAFFYSASVQVESQKQVRVLQGRIEQLEAAIAATR